MSDEEKTTEPADAEAPDAEAAEGSKKKLPIRSIAVATAGALAMGGVSGGAAYMFAPGGGACTAPAAAAAPAKSHKPDVKDVAFVKLEPLVISLGPDARSKYLKISISLETSKTFEKSLDELSPRLRDVLNNYLRAVEESDLERPAGMTRLRAQMLRRLQLVAPEHSISDILITDFVLT